MISALALSLVTQAQSTSDPFALLRDGYARRDAHSAATAYTDSALVIYRYRGAVEERYSGPVAIAGSFRKLFDQLNDSLPVDLNFRMMSRTTTRATGFYRLRFGRGQTAFGRFAVRFAPDGRFAEDVSSDATREEFEEAPGAVLLAADDEELDGTYYQRLVGRYVRTDGCEIVVTRSVVRLFARDTCTQSWRRLTRISGRTWAAGDRVVSDKLRDTLQFSSVDSGQAQRLSWRTRSGTRVATRQNTYNHRDVTYKSVDGTRLAGTIYTPIAAAVSRSAVVIIHGSGAQDRHGYASIIAVIADEIATAGRVVLTFDKRGVGGSAGDWSRASFETLADDAAAAATFLATVPGVDRTRIGFAGSSQAGWVVAKAIARGVTPADVFLLGAAGAAITVADQNLYNTEVRMRCDGLSPASIAIGLNQQRAFFAFLRDSTMAPQLNALSRQGRTIPSLTDWLFPDAAEVNRASGEWYTTLDPEFDPLPIWRAYRGHADFLFSEYDDATPTSVVRDRLRGTRVQVHTLAGAQHLGLKTNDRCHGALSDVTMFAPELFARLRAFARAQR